MIKLQVKVWVTVTSKRNEIVAVIAFLLITFTYISLWLHFHISWLGVACCMYLEKMSKTPLQNESHILGYSIPDWNESHQNTNKTLVHISAHNTCNSKHKSKQPFITISINTYTSCIYNWKYCETNPSTCIQYKIET